MPPELRRDTDGHGAGESQPTLLVLSDYKPLNMAHVAFLGLHGYRTLAAITYTDAVRMLSGEAGTTEICAIVVASKVHGWHHLEGETRPAEIPAKSESWQMENIKHIYDLVARNQHRPPLLFVAHDLIETGWYHITADGLEELGLQYQVYQSGDLATVTAALGE